MPASAGIVPCAKPWGADHRAPALLLGHRHQRPRLRLGGRRSGAGKLTRLRPGAPLGRLPYTVGEFLREVHRLVADFALGQILKGHSTEGLDEWTRYYLMHRNNFGLAGRPAGECILFAQGYGLDLNDLRGQRGFLVKATGSDLRLAKWDERSRTILVNRILPVRYP